MIMASIAGVAGGAGGGGGGCGLSGGETLIDLLLPLLLIEKT